MNKLQFCCLSKIPANINDCHQNHAHICYSSDNSVFIRDITLLFIHDTWSDFFFF